MHWDIPGAKVLKENPNATSLRSFWLKNKKDTIPFMFPDKVSVQLFLRAYVSLVRLLA